MLKAPKFYAVAKGHKRGIYATWEECEAQINNFKGAKHQKFKSRAEAEIFVNEKSDQSEQMTISAKSELTKGSTSGWVASAHTNQISISENCIGFISFYVTNIPPNVDSVQLSHLLSKFGSVRTFSLNRQPGTRDGMARQMSLTRLI